MCKIDWAQINNFICIQFAVSFAFIYLFLTAVQEKKKELQWVYCYCLLITEILISGDIWEVATWRQLSKSFSIEIISALILSNIHVWKELFTNTSTSKKGLSFVVHGYRAMETYYKVNRVYRDHEV